MYTTRRAVSVAGVRVRYMTTNSELRKLKAEFRRKNMICENMPTEEYRAAEGQNVSQYKRWWEEDGEKLCHEMEKHVTVSEAMEFGTLTHRAVLEPENFDGSYALFSGKTKKGKAWNEFKEANAPLTITSADRLESLVIMGQKLKKDTDSMNLLSGCSSEVSLFWQDECGIKCKARLDIVKPQAHQIADIKTMADISARSFINMVDKQGGMIQAGHYVEGYRKCYGLDHNPSFSFICMETVAPYRVVCRHLTEDVIEYGRRKNKETLARIHIGRVSGAWDTLADREAMREFGLPSWRQAEEQDMSKGKLEASAL